MRVVQTKQSKMVRILTVLCRHSDLTEELHAMQRRTPIGARHRSGSGNAITELGHGRFAQAPWPNSAVKRTPTLAMPAASSWPVFVPFTRCAPSGAAYLGR